MQWCSSVFLDQLTIDQRLPTTKVLLQKPAVASIVIKLLSLPVVCMEGANLSAHCCKLLEVQ